LLDFAVLRVVTLCLQGRLVLEFDDEAIFTVVTGKLFDRMDAGHAGSDGVDRLQPFVEVLLRTRPGLARNTTTIMA
jgi:hypothetical protein